MDLLHKLQTFTKEHGAYLILLVIMLTGSAFLLWSDFIVDAKIASTEESARPAEVELIQLTVPNCLDCFDVDVVLKAVESGPFEIIRTQKVMYDSEEGKRLIEKYTISNVPTVIIKGEFDKENAETFLKNNVDQKIDAAIWTSLLPVFLDALTGEVFGRVQVTFINDASCDECYDPRKIENIVRNNYGVKISEQRSYDRYSSEGQKLIERYNIKILPTLLLSSDAVVYKQLISTWPNVGSIEKDGSFVVRNVRNLGYIYRDLETGEIVNPITDK